ncbi:MAG TPA: flagellar filament capping protein FliD [Sphingomonas sp.]|nr:flagellar filament capping protein FliD [Sphingomonas sp.]
MTTTSSTASATSGTSILTALGAGSGIDTAALVTNLAAATFDPKDNALKAREAANTAKISSLGTLSSGIDSFATALQSLVSGGTLRSQPSSSNSAILTATAQSGAVISGLSAQLQVRQLAQAQAVESPPLTSSTTAVGLGSLTLASAAGSFTITVDATNNSLAGLASAINAKNSGATPSGVSASVVTDSNGARLVLRGATGAANTFSVTANGDADADLRRFATTGVGALMTQAQAAQDAIIRMDGVDSSHSSNVVGDLITGVTLNLMSAQPGTSVSLGVTRPTSAITQAVNDYVAAYNELKKEIDSATAAGSGDAAGPFRGNSGIREMQRQLAKLSSTTLSSLPNGPQTLAEIGVSTGRDGTLSVNSTKLASALTSYPDAVEAMFNPSQRSDNPLIKITSGMTATKPGTYALANIVAGSSPSGMIGGVAALPSPSNPTRLIASITSSAAGLEIEPLGDVLNATVTVDPGLSGALQSIRDGLRANTGVLKALSDSLTAETKSLADARIKLTDQESAYKDQLSKQFSTMQTQVASYKSIQSYLTQQIAIWSKSA